MKPSSRPRLRPLEVKRLVQDGRTYFHLRDHLALAGDGLLVPVELGPLLMLLDGEHDLALLRSRLLLEYRLALSAAEISLLVGQLDNALLLEGDNLQQALAAALAAFRSAGVRPLALADRVYPADPEALRRLLLAYHLRAGTETLPAGRVAGVLSPHIDYARGGIVYAQGWQQAADAARAAERIIVLGTDHAGGGGRFTLTGLRYGTPYGPMDDDAPLRELLTAALGQENAFRDELHHRSEHSVELATVWLHHVRDGRPAKLTAILCGHPGPLLRDGLSREPAIAAMVEVLKGAVADGALVVVAGDLAHVGPAFGDPDPFGPQERAKVRESDISLIDACSRGVDAILAQSRANDDQYRVCGLSSLALALAILPPVRLDVAAYEQCAADDEDASFVSIAGGCFVKQ